MPPRSHGHLHDEQGHRHLEHLTPERRAFLERQHALRQRVQWSLQPYPSMPADQEAIVEPEMAPSLQTSRDYLPGELLSDLKAIGNYRDMSDLRLWKEGDQMIFYYGKGDHLVRLHLPENPHDRAKILQKYVLLREVNLAGQISLKLYPKSHIKHAYLGNETSFRNIKNVPEVSACMATDIRHHQDEEKPRFTHVQIEFLQKKARELTGETPEKTIENIYQYIIHNFTYEPEMASYFSGQLGYMPDIAPGNYGGLVTQHKEEGVCQGIARSFLYLLSFAGIENVHVVSGLVPHEQQIFWRRFFGRDTWTVDKKWFLPWKLWKGILPTMRSWGFMWKDVWTEEDKKNMAHAWNRIGLRHYDATFDLGKEKPEWFGIDESTVRYKGREF